MKLRCICYLTWGAIGLACLGVGSKRRRYGVSRNPKERGGDVLISGNEIFVTGAYEQGTRNARN